MSGEEIAIELARIERAALERVAQRMLAQQHHAAELECCERYAQRVEARHADAA